jgi:DnaD/phage-associated family protein
MRRETILSVSSGVVMKYKLNRDFEGRVFAVPDYVVDDCVKLADPKWTKVILYLFRHQHEAPADINEIASALGTGIQEEDVETALSFWKEVGVVIPSGGERPAASDAGRKDAGRETAKAETETNSVGISEARRRERDVKSLTPVEIAERINASKELGYLFKAAEDMWARLPNHTEQRTLVHLFDYYGLPADILLMILSYCKSEDIKGMATVENIAREWHEKGIVTHKQADDEIKRMQTRGTLIGKIKTRLEINRGLTPKERAFAEDWSDKRIGVELVTLAYEKTVGATGKMSFNYMNKILIGWYDSGYRTVSQVLDADKAFEADRKYPSKSARSGTLDRTRTPDASLNIGDILERSMNSVPVYVSKRKGKTKTDEPKV